MTNIWEIDDGDERIEGLDASGRPDPAYAAALGLVRAPFPRRAVAAVIDGVAVTLLQLPLWLLTLPLLILFVAGDVSLYGLVMHPSFILAVVGAGITVLATLILTILQLVLHGGRGVTIGKAIVSVRSVNVRTLEKPGFWRVVLRGLVVLASGITIVGPVLFCASPLWDPGRRGRGWHDAAGQVWMIDIRHGLDPYDEKRMRIARKTVKAASAPERPSLPSLATPATEQGATAYRPAARVSAGVLGVARPHHAGEAARVDPSVRPADAASDEARREPPADLLGAPPEQPAPRRPEPAPGAVEAESPAPSPSAPGPSSAPAPAEPEPAVVRGLEYVLIVDTGQRIPVAGTVIVGRAPQPRGDASAAAIADDTRSISKTHISARAMRRGLEITDLGSTNGTELERAGEVRPLVAGTPVLASVGDTVRFGERSLVISLPQSDRLA